jgi:hypothetical protein
MNRWSRRRIIRCWSDWTSIHIVTKPKVTGWTDARAIGSSDGHFWIYQPQNSSDAFRKAGVGSSDAMLWNLTCPIQSPLSFLSILLLMYFHEYFELFSTQGTWVCIFSWLLVNDQASSAWTPLNSTVKHYKLAIQVSFICLWHLELTKSLAL